MERELLTRLHGYFSKIETPTEDEKLILERLTDELPYFTVTSVCRDDLRSRGFDAARVSDEAMEYLAREMGDHYLDQQYWDDMETLAAEELDIPRREETVCPACGSGQIGFDFGPGRHVCQSCGRQWGDHYVLVGFPEDGSHFENGEIGYPCFNSHDNGARYVPEYDYIGHFRKAPSRDSLYRPVLWPESQRYLHRPDSRCEVIIADEKALADFGGSAVWVPVGAVEGNAGE
jgi:hypothetical protein